MRTTAPDQYGRVSETKSEGTDAPIDRTSYEFPQIATPFPDSITLDADGEHPLTLTPHFDTNGYLERLEAPGGVEHTTTYNTLGWLLEECRDIGGVNACTRYKYDENGNVVELLPPDPAKEVELLDPAVEDFFNPLAGDTARVLALYDIDSQGKEVKRDEKGDVVQLSKLWKADTVEGSREYNLGGILVWPYGYCSLDVHARGPAALEFETEYCVATKTVMANRAGYAPPEFS